MPAGAARTKPGQLSRRDESLEDSANLPDPDVLAREIVGELKAALEQFTGIVEDLGEEAR
jgi:type I restriction enzyme M protein